MDAGHRCPYTCGSWRCREGPHPSVRHQTHERTRRHACRGGTHRKARQALAGKIRQNGRTRFTHTFAYNRGWHGKVYRRKTIEAYAVDRGGDDWLVITAIVKYF